MIIDIAKYTNSGGHQINEDSIFCGTDLFIVADGLGGHYGGENASAAAVSYITEMYRGDISDSEIEQLLEGANNAVNKLNDGSHTTLAAAFVSGERIRIANVGDSRVYIFRNNKVYTVTKDHSVCQAAADMGEMSYEDIRFSDDRSRLLKVLGSENTLNLKTKYEPIELYDADAFLICSDGFWEYVHEREMEADLLKADSAESWKRLMLKRHLMKAKNEGDNYSLICAIVHSDRVLSTAYNHVAAPIPATVAINNTEQPPVKRSNGLLIILIILLLASLATFCFLFAGKLFKDESRTVTDISSDAPITETIDCETDETTEPLPAESQEQPPAISEDATAESQENPEMTTAETIPHETVESTTAEAEERLPDNTFPLPSISDDEPSYIEPEMPIPVNPEITSAPNQLFEPASDSGEMP